MCSMYKRWSYFTELSLYTEDENNNKLRSELLRSFFYEKLNRVRGDRSRHHSIKNAFATQVISSRAPKLLPAVISAPIQLLSIMRQDESPLSTDRDKASYSHPSLPLVENMVNAKVSISIIKSYCSSRLKICLNFPWVVFHDK